MDRKPGLQVNRVSIFPVKLQHLLYSMQEHFNKFKIVLWGYETLMLSLHFDKKKNKCIQMKKFEK